MSPTCTDCGVTTAPDPRGGFTRCDACRSALLERTRESLRGQPGKPKVLPTIDYEHKAPKLSYHDRRKIRAARLTDERAKQLAEFVRQTGGVVPRAQAAAHLGLSRTDPAVSRAATRARELGLIRTRASRGYEAVPDEQRQMAQRAFKQGGPSTNATLAAEHLDRQVDELVALVKSEGPIMRTDAMAAMGLNSSRVSKVATTAKRRGLITADRRAYAPVEDAA